MCEYDAGNYKFNIQEKRDEIINEILLPLKKELWVL
jgi:hypothetical protein